MKNTELGAKSKIYPDNPSNSSNMERDQNDSFNLPIIMEYNMMFVDNKKTSVTLGFFEEAVGKQT